MSDVPDTLGIIAGKGVYPLLLAEAARAQGVPRLVAVAFRGETDRRLAGLVDAIHWIHLGRLGRMLDALRDSGVREAVMAGQITPTHLFRVRLDGRMLALLKRLPARNAETIFGAVADELRALGIALIPASRFMEAHMPAAGVLSRRKPTEAEAADIALGRRVAKVSSGLEIGQTVVVKNGTILAVEAFEGTNAAIRRAGRLGGPGCVVVKVAKEGHDMRFDIPVVGRHTLRILRKARAAALAIEAGRAIVLERDAVVADADKINLAFVALERESADA
jgi:UDP-2,3-diacylglucosamine hydrolase